MSLGMIAAGVSIVGGVAAMSASNKARKQGDRAIAGQEAAAARQAALAEKQDARDEEQWLRYKNTFQPLEDQMIDEAKGAGSAANQNKAAADSAATVAAGFSNVRNRLNKNPGINPASQQYQQLESQIGLAEAAKSAEVQTDAREATRDRGTKLLTNALSLGKGMPANQNTDGGAGIYNSMASNAAARGRQDMANMRSGAEGIAGLVDNKAVQDWASSPDRFWKNDGGYGVGQGSAYAGTTTDGVWIPNRRGM